MNETLQKKNQSYCIANKILIIHCQNIFSFLLFELNYNYVQRAYLHFIQLNTQAPNKKNYFDIKDSKYSTMKNSRYAK